ncbi:MAG: RES domain-containing protein [Acidimicrobiales bacterium]
MRLYRVCPVDPLAAEGSAYHPGFVPRSTGQHRIDNPDRYDTLYLARAAAGAVAERFGPFTHWGDWLLEHPRGFTARLVTFDLPDDRAVLDLDNAGELVARSMRPSRVVTRNRTTTQAWAARVHSEDRWAGVSWWSFYDPDWASCGLWCSPDAAIVEGLAVVDVETLRGDHPAVAEAGRSLLRHWA